MTSLALINQFLGQPANFSEHGFQIDHIIEFCHWFMGALFIGWLSYFIFVLWRFRKSRNPVANHEGVTSGISTHLEFAVVLIEAVLLVGFAIPLWAKRVNAFPNDKDAIVVQAIGQQFNWNFHLPGPDGVFGRQSVDLISNTNPIGLDPTDPNGKDDLVVLGELHVPVDRNVIVDVSSKDVIHNFDLPSMRIAQDAIPGQVSSDVVQTDQDRNLRDRVRSALRSRALRHERDARGRHASGLSGLVEGTGGTGWHSARAGQNGGAAGRTKNSQPGRRIKKWTGIAPGRTTN